LIAKEAKDQGAMGPEFLRAQPSGFASGGSIVSSDDMISSEMTDGYRDGLDPDSPEPSANRTQSYWHGFLNGRDDLRRQPRVRGEEAAADDAKGLSEGAGNAEFPIDLALQ
jgi:hypothetical protein